MGPPASKITPVRRQSAEVCAAHRCCVAAGIVPDFQYREIVGALSVDKATSNGSPWRSKVATPDSRSSRDAFHPLTSMPSSNRAGQHEQSIRSVVIALGAHTLHDPIG